MEKREKVVGQDKGNTVLHRAAPGFRSDSYDLAGPYYTVRTVLYGTGRTLLYGAQKKLSHPGTWRVPRGLSVAAPGMGLLLFSGWCLRLRITLTDSASAAGIYRVVDGPLARGALVAACLPPVIAQQGMARGYLQRGDCPAGAEPVAKVIGALPGDAVDVEPGAVTVNGTLFPDSQTARVDSHGRPLAHVLSGARRVGSGEVWLFGFNNVRSWDARYFGPVPLANVRGELKPLVTW